MSSRNASAPSCRNLPRKSLFNLCRDALSRIFLRSQLLTSTQISRLFSKMRKSTPGQIVLPSCGSPLSCILLSFAAVKSNRNPLSSKTLILAYPLLWLSISILQLPILHEHLVILIKNRVRLYCGKVIGPHHPARAPLFMQGEEARLNRIACAHVPIPKKQIDLLQDNITMCRQKYLNAVS